MVTGHGKLIASSPVAVKNFANSASKPPLNIITLTQSGRPHDYRVMLAKVFPRWLFGFGHIGAARS
jgi:hypothetical protein